MLDKLKESLNNRFVQLGLALFVGLVIGALFYPSRTTVKTTQVEDTEQYQKLEHDKEAMELHYKEQIDVYNEASRNTQEQLNNQIDKLNEEVKTLSSKSKSSYYKIVHPDGTVEIHKETQNDTEQTDQIAESYKQQYQKQLQDAQTSWQASSDKKVSDLKSDYDKQISDLQTKIHSSETYSKEEVNKRTTGIEAGLLTSGNYYLHVDRDLFGPIYLGVHGEMGRAGASAGGGLGLRW